MCQRATDLDGYESPESFADRRERAASMGRGDCARCGDPLPADGKCDCAGDEDRDTRTGWRGLKPRPMVVRMGNTDEMVEVWL